MNSLGRRGGNFADSFPGVEGECLDASGNGAAPGFVCGPDKSCVLLIEYGNGADGFCSNAGSGNDVRLSTVEEDGFGECCNGIVAENGISGSAGFNACVNVAEMTCAARSCNGKASDDLNRVWLDGACENNVALVGLRNGTEANGFEVGNKDCTCQACSGVENASSVNGNCDRMDGPHTFHNAAASEDGTELPLARRGTEDGCGVGDLCSKESGMQKRLHSSFLCNGCGNSLEMGCQLIDGVVIGRQDWLCVNVASAVDEEPSAAVRTELVDDSENPLRTDYPFVDCNGKRDSDGKDAQDRICSYVAPLDDEEPSVTVRNESGEGGKTSSGTDCPVEDDNRRIYGNGDGGQGGLCFKIASVGDEKPLVTMRKELKDSCDNPPESAYPLVDGIGENGNGLCLNVTSADDEELSAYVKNDVEVVSITSSEMAQPKMNHVGESGKIDLCFKADSVENEELLAATKTDLEDGYVNSLEAAFPLIDGNGLCSNVDPVNVSEPWVVRGNVGIDEFGAKKLCSGNRDDMEHCEDALVTAHHLINGRLHLDVASKNNGEPSSTEGNDTTEESRHSSHESDMESQMCNSNLWDRRENLSEAVYPTDDVADAFRSYVSSENEVEPSICVNGDDDAQRGGAFFSKRSDWKTSVCTSQLSNGHGNIMGPSSTLTDNNADVMEGQNEVGLGVISGNNREALIAGKLHPDERHVDGQSCCLLQVNSCEDALQMTCSLNSAADMLDCLPDEPQIKIASLDDSEAWIIEKEGIVGYGVCSSSSENDTANRLSMGSMNDGPYPDKAVPLSLLKVPSHNEEMSLSSLVTKNEKMENYVSGSSEETASSFREVEQERSLIEACILTGPATHTSCSGGNSIEGSPSEVFHCSVEELALTHSKCSTGLGYTEKDATASAVVFSECADNEAKFSSQLDHVFRNNGSCKSNRSSRTRKAARQCQQAANTIGVFLNNARRKRSYSSERRRSSLWGSMGNIVQLFKQGAEILKFDSQLTKMLNQGSKSGKAVSGRRRQLKTHNRGTTRGSQAKVCASAKRAQLNVKKEEGGERSLESVPSEVVDSSASVLTINGCSPESDCCVGLEVPKSASEVECKFEGDACDVQGFPFIDQNLKKLENRLEISARDAHGGDKDIESTVTQEMSIENTSGHYPGVSHGSLAEASGEAVENMHPYPGMTPGMNSLPSIPVVGISSTEGAVYTRRKTSSKSRMKDQNGFIADPTVPSCLDDAVSIPPDAIAAPVNVMPPKMNCPSTKEVTTTTSGEVKEGQHESAGCSSFEEKLVCPAKLNKARKSTRQRLMPKMAGDFDAVGNCRITSGKDSNQTSNSGMLTKKSLVLDATEAESWKGTFKVDPEVGIRECFGQDVGISQSEPCKSDGLLTAGKIKEHKPQKRSADASRKCRSRATDSAKHGRGNAHGGKKNSRKKDKCTRLSRHVPYKEEMRAVADGAESGEIHEEGNSIFSNQGRNSNNDAVVSEDIVNSVKSPVYNDKALTKSCDALEVQCLQPQVAWVRCDDCFKWRCISAALADEIEETNRKWTCKDNMDKAFADCSIPQEKSNAEINAELEISDASCEEDSCGTNPVSKGSERKQLGASQQATWTLIKSNIFLQRSCKTQTIDEVMVCQCKPTLDGSLGCRDECLNRMLNIECVKGTCPCGNLCSNQQFQKRKYAKFKWIRCGKKGYGLELQEDVSKGTFLIEYVGEVLDLHTYEGRQRDYAARGQKHFYFMTLNGSEVIDACAKGNLGRFINHSCDPNCRTEKWMVNGEVCIGLFAVRDIKKGEEVTFDYNYVRVFGAAAKKCFCGSSECRGYIGGDLQSTEVIVQGDSDDEYPEPVMVCDDGDSDHNLDEMIPRASSLGVAYKQHAEISSGMIRGTGKSSPTVQLLEDSSQKQHSTKKSSPHSQQFDALQIEDVTIKSSPRQHFGDNLEEDSMSKLLASAPKSEIFFETDDSKSKSLSCVEPHEISSEIASVMGVPFAVAVDDKSMPTSGTVEKKPDLSKCPISRSSRSSGTIKKGKCSSYQLMANKLKRVADGSGRSHFEGVEQKLNELLDADGGISKRKDATKGYLKLLFVTAASGDHTEASHSTRDLSLVLDALLKTKSRMVLVDIMNKNGLQMLHNIMKQSRLNFNKTPILRKLLKVLEFLALKEILTLEHINTAPPCVGMESFKESMLSLTRHSDSQVHQIARSFRDRWIPRTIKQFYSERDDCRLESQNGYCNRFVASHKRWHGQGLRQSDAIHCISQTLPASVPLDDSTPVATSLLPSQLGSEAPSADNAPTDGMKRKRRRKSRWDQPVETNLDPQPLQYIEHQTVEMNSNFKTQASLSQPETCAEVLSHASESHGETTKTNLNDDGPPGFSLPFKNHQVSSIAPFSVTCSFSPSQVPQSSGVCEAVIAHPQPRFLAHLPVSFGIPLALVQQLGTPQGEDWLVAPGMPFHPFPPLPPYPRGQTNLPSIQASVVDDNRLVDEAREQHGGDCGCAEDARVASNGGAQEIAANGANNPHTVGRVRWASDSLGRRFFRQQKWNNKEFRKCPPWLRPRNGWGFKGNNHVRSMSSQQSV